MTFIAGMLVVALAQVREDARAARTRSQINRINQLLMTRWDSYRTRKVPLAISNIDLKEAGRIRLNAIRELMRMELPDRITDVQDDPVVKTTTPPVTTLSIPALTRRYRRIVTANGGYASWSTTHKGAECLYMILGSIQTEGGNGLDFFRESEKGDADDDGMPEILDAWGQPIEFIRWPVGMSATRQAASGINNRSWSVIQHGDTVPATDGKAGDAPDPFDYLKVDAKWNDGIATNDPFAIYPLVVSAGPDKVIDIVFDTPTPLQYSKTDPKTPPLWPNDPYVIPNGGAQQIGEPKDIVAPIGEPDKGFWDNISNHQGLDN